MHAVHNVWSYDAIMHSMHLATPCTIGQVHLLVSRNIKIAIYYNYSLMHMLAYQVQAYLVHSYTEPIIIIMDNNYDKNPQSCMYANVFIG